MRNAKSTKRLKTTVRRFRTNILSKRRDFSFVVVCGIVFWLGSSSLVPADREKNESFAADQAIGQAVAQTFDRTVGQTSEPATEQTTIAFDETAAKTVYRNPIDSVEKTDWDDYGVGDPFVFRFNGRYYLYCSTKDTEVGVKCWSSKNLVDWKYEGLCSELSLTRGAYAPEVCYYNGRFFMYSSPAGKGHYVLSADSPTGPFRQETDNLGLSIDGSVFIDDDGDWFFFHAGESGILARRMTSPTQIDSTPIRVAAFMNGWTEGPAVVKRDGRYYITYAGNHVFCRGYRIDCAVGDSPLRFVPLPENPILIHTENDPYGIGHSSTVKGPDLDQDYIVYHSLTGRSKIGAPTRRMNVDRLVFNETELSVAGPTTTEQTVYLPDFAVYFESENDLGRFIQKNDVSLGRSVDETVREAIDSESFQTPTKSSETPKSLESLKSPESEERRENRVVDGFLQTSEHSLVLSRESIDGDFVAEFNVSSDSDVGELGAVFCYSASDRFGTVGFDLATQSMIVSLRIDGQETVATQKLPRSFGEKILFSSLQSIQVEKQGDEFRFSANDRLVLKLDSELTDGSIGYYSRRCPGRFGFIGATRLDPDRTAFRYPQPVPGSVCAAASFVCPKTAKARLASASDGSRFIQNAGRDDSLSCWIDVEEEGEYDFSLVYATIDETAAYSLRIDDSLVAASKRLVSTGNSTLFKTDVRRRVELPAGKRRLTLQVDAGSFDFSRLSFQRRVAVSEIEQDFSDSNDDCSYSDGSWSIENGAIVLNESQPFGKRLFGDSGWGDYSVEAELTILNQDVNAGLVFRVQNPANGGAGNDPSRGVDFMQGYFAGLKTDGIVLGKINYSWTPLAHAYFPVKKNQAYRMKIEAVEDRVKIFVDDILYIDYQDGNPFLQGKIGFRGVRSCVRFDNLVVRPTEESPRSSD